MDVGELPGDELALSVLGGYLVFDIEDLAYREMRSVNGSFFESPESESSYEARKLGSPIGQIGTAAPTPLGSGNWRSASASAGLRSLRS